MEDDLAFDFEGALQGTSPRAAQQAGVSQAAAAPSSSQAAAAPQPGAPGFVRNHRQTVCTYWLRGLCMRGDACSFLHQYDKDRMPVCRTFVQTGQCNEPDCPFKHAREDIKECNMYKLGFCVYGPHCRYRHTWSEGPPPPGAQAAQKLNELHRMRVRRAEQQQRQAQQQQRPPTPPPSQQLQQKMLPSPTEQPMLALPAPGGFLPQQQQQQQQQQVPGPRPPPGLRPPPGPPPQQQQQQLMQQHHLLQQQLHQTPPLSIPGMPSPFVFNGPGINLPPPFLQSEQAGH